MFSKIFVQRPASRAVDRRDLLINPPLYTLISDIPYINAVNLDIIAQNMRKAVA